MRIRGWVAAVALTGCGRVGFDPEAPAVGALEGETIARFESIDTRVYGVIARPGGFFTASTSLLPGDLNVAEVMAWTDDGELDPAYGTGGVLQLAGDGRDFGYNLARLADGRILLLGDSALGTDRDDMLFIRLDAAGALDPTFGAGGSQRYDAQLDDTVNAVVESAGGYVACGVSSREEADSHHVLVRSLAAGVQDASWGANGLLQDDAAEGGRDRCWDAVAGPGDRILAVGAGGDELVVTQYLASGARDPDFAAGGRWQTTDGDGAIGYALARDAEGGSVIAGVDGGAALVLRLDARGVPRPAFGNGGRAALAHGAGESDELFDVLLQPDGAIVVVGARTRIADGDTDALVARLLPDGRLDPDFADGGVLRIDHSPEDVLQAVVAPGGGRLVAVGHTQVDGSDRAWLLRLR